MIEVAKINKRAMYRQQQGGQRSRKQRQAPKHLAKWVVKHRTSARGCFQAACPVSAFSDFPDYAMLPDRVKDLIDCANLSVPHPIPLLVEVS